VIAALCPGQGSQTPGMLAPWLELPGASERLGAWSEAAELDLVALGTTADADTIRDTAVAQPLIVAASLLSYRTLATEVGDVVGLVAGHSVGELSAAAIAGVLDDAQAIALVAARGRAMARAATLAPSGMSAVVGGDPDEVLAAIAAAGLHAANVNGGGQVVAAGGTAELDALAASPPARARVIPLPVAGAFHTPYMDAARDEFAAAVHAVTARDPRLPLLSNADGGLMPADGAAVLERLLAQVTAPVRWDLCQATLGESGATALIELAPGGVLTGLAKRTLRGTPAVAIRTPEDLDDALALVRATPAPTTDEERA
jgi:[acyl-carrier-protein] S-malonyltransferase